MGDPALDAALQTLVDRGRREGLFDDAPVSIHPLPGDGSERKFFRLRQKKCHCIGLLSPRQCHERAVDENDSYLLIGRHLEARGVPVPRILWADVHQGRFLLEDVGNCHLQRRALRAGDGLLGLYQGVIQILVHLHRTATDGFQAEYCFDSRFYDARFVYERELEYFRKAFLIGYMGAEVSEEDLKPDFERLAEAAGTRDNRFVFHRDFQSRNIMIWRGDLRLLDFQGLRFGPPAYDLASLLLDPYVMLPLQIQESLVQHYWSSAQKFLDCSGEAFRESYRSTRLCRNLQALAAFGFLGTVKGKTQFLQYIPGALKQLQEWLEGPCRNIYPRIRKWADHAAATTFA